MKTLQINLVVSALFLLVSVNINAQTSERKSTPKNTSSSISESPVTNDNIVVSEYFNMEKKIVEWSVAGEIPSNFPKHVEGETKEQYVAIIKAWAKDNLSLIKKEHHRNVLSNRPTNNKTNK